MKDWLANFFTAWRQPWLFYLLKSQKNSAKENWKIFQENFKDTETIPKRNSDTLIIFGSGPTVNDLGEKEWKAIEKMDTLALNQWPMYMDFAPNFYIYESAEPDWFHHPLVESINSRKEGYKNTVLFFKFYTWYKRRGNLSEAFSALDPALQKQLFNFRVRRTNFFSFRKNPKESLKISPLGPYPQIKGTVTSTTFFGHAMGYKKIILVGFDLQGGYFWEKDVPKDKQHKTNTKVKRNPWTVSDVVPEMAKALKEAGTEVFVSSKGSILSEKIPVYAF